MEKKFEKYALGGLKIHFPGANLALATSHVDLPRFRIGWYIQGSDLKSASTRYRCFHFARALDQDFESLFFSNYKDLKNDIRDLDAIIIVKRLDRSTTDLAALARHRGKPLFLDLCDDLADPRHPARDPFSALTFLLGLAPTLSGIVVPSAKMAERIDGYLADNGFCRQLCHVIPDIAETREIFAETERFVRKRAEESATLGALEESATPGGLEESATPGGLEESVTLGAPPRRIIWFGNYGGSHSNFGIFSLKPRLKKLRDFHRECPIELVIISNNKTVYEALVAGCGFPTRYVSWSPSAIYEELHRADVALLTTGDDDFCAVKSSNRVLQALAASVPVITEKSPALAEFEEVIFTGKNLEEALGPDRDKFVAPRLALAALLLQRYTPERLAGQWSDLLKRAIGRTLVRRATEPRHGILLLLDVDDDPDRAIAAIQTANQTAGLDYDFLVSLDLLREDQAFGWIIRRARSLPMFFSGRLGRIESQLAQRSAVVIGDPESVNGEIVSQVAQQLGIAVLTLADAVQAGLERFATQSGGRASAASRIQPGPYPERIDPDGSVEWAFVIHNQAKGWILDAICREIGSRQPRSWAVVDHTSPPPRARNLFFSHFSLLDLFDNKHPDALAASKAFVWYTHPRDEDANSVARNLYLFNRATRIIFTCESNRQMWIERGLDPEKAIVVLGAADPVLFGRHERGGGVVGLSSSFYERKNPELLLNVVKTLQHRNFVLLGRHWNRYAQFEELLALPNFTYLTLSYREYPRVYSTFDVFLSISSLEGGPIPLIEAMMCNAVPVASNTGFAPDVIEHGRNGFLFEIEDGPHRVSRLIEQAFALDVDVRKTVEQYSWDRFSAEIVRLAT
jgi:glycosyltransferase involved in cell wall biosynthesis